MSAALQSPVPGRMTAEEFLAWPGDGSGTPYQLIDGDLVAMAPPSETHALIHGRVAILLGVHVGATRPECRVAIGPGVSPRLFAKYNVRIPDVVVTCTPNDPRRHLVDAPVLIVEILSPSNERETRQNLWAFATIPSVQEVLFIRTIEIGAELFRRDTDDNWPTRPMALGPGDTVRLGSVGGSFALADFYTGTSLAEPAP